MRNFSHFIFALLITSTAIAQQGSDLVTTIDKNEDGKITEAEWIELAVDSFSNYKDEFIESRANELFHMIDADKNATISREELDAIAFLNEKFRAQQ